MSADLSGESGEQDDLRHDLEALEKSSEGHADPAFADLGGLGGAVGESLRIAADGLVARLWRLDADSTRADIEKLLAHHEISFGVDWDAIEQALELALRGQVQHGLVVARGIPARIIDAARVVFHPGLEDAEEDFAILRQQLQASSLELASRREVEVVAVEPGTILAEWQPARVEVGRTVRGEEVRPPTQMATGLRPGDGVSMSADGHHCASEIYGYAGLANGRLHVVSPLWVAPGTLEVHFVHLPSLLTAEAPQVADLIALLQRAGITHGIDGQALRALCKRLAQSAGAPFTHELARVKAPSAGDLAPIRYPFDLRALSTWDQLQALMRQGSVEEMSAALELTLRDSGLRFPLMGRGDWVAEKKAAAGEQVGNEEGGEEGEEDELPALEVGEFVELSADGLRAVADLCGYACMRGERIALVPPVWVTPDANAAYFINLPQGPKPRYPQIDEMNEILDLLGVVYGYRESVWFDALRALEAGRKMPLLVAVAKALPHGESRDASFEWEIDVEGNRAGKILEDGSIDFRARTRAPAVREADLIGSLVQPRRGESGRDVLGRELPAPQPLGIEVVTDAHINSKTRGERVQFYAGRGGEVISENEIVRSRHRTRRRLRIGISLVSNIDGDVGYATGNIDFSGDVIISGSVQSLFSVRAEGSVHIGGYIEDGAIVAAGKDIMVRGGIIGAATQVDAGGTLWAKFAQEASVRARGDVRVGAYIFNASVRACGRVVVLGRGEGKARSLVGGLVWGGLGIDTLSVGSAYNSATRLVVGVDPVQVERLETLRGELHSCEERMQAFMEALGLSSIDVEEIRARLRRPTTRERRRDALLAVKRLARLSERRQQLRTEMNDIIAAQRLLARQARIVVRGKLYSGVDVRLGEESLSYNEEKQHLQLRLSESEGKLRIVEGPITRASEATN